MKFLNSLRTDFDEAFEKFKNARLVNAKCNNIYDIYLFALNEYEIYSTTMDTTIIQIERYLANIIAAKLMFNKDEKLIKKEAEESRRRIIVDIKQAMEDFCPECNDDDKSIKPY